MPLKLAQKVELTLLLSAARHLDPDCDPKENPDACTLLNAVRGAIAGKAKGAAHAVRSDNDAQLHLYSAIHDIERLMADQCLDSLPQISQVCNYLKKSSIQTSCFDELIEVIESRIRVIINQFYRTILQMFPQIKYDYNITEKLFAGFKINGDTNIKTYPRAVYFAINAHDLRASDIVYVAYTIYHELICHALQGALSSDPPDNAPPTCHWSEGWMDTLTFEIVLDWFKRNGAPKEWFPLYVTDVEGKLWYFHNARYGHNARYEEEQLTALDVQRRQRARTAYKKLISTLASLFKDDQIDSEQFARNIVWKFSCLVNIHRDANTIVLSEISTYSQIALLSINREDAQYRVAAACIDFIATQDFKSLRNNLERAAHD